MVECGSGGGEEGGAFDYGSCGGDVDFEDGTPSVGGVPDVLADAREVGTYGDVVLLECSSGANAGDHEELRGMPL